MQLPNLRGKVIYLLVIIIINNLLYPLSELGGPSAAIQAMAYSLLVGMSVYFIAPTRGRWVSVISITSFTIVITGLWNSFPEITAFAYGAFGTLVIFQLVVMFYLLEFLFGAEHVTRDVLFAAMALYLLIADTYTPFYMILELITQQTTGGPAFIIANQPGVAVQWQDTAYFSFVTLATLGYGDILPLTSVAQVAAISESVIGVFYSTILLGRLVGLYAQAPTTSTAATASGAEKTD